ncbi:DUF58 domain-containing protein [Brevibacillus fulvus]|uniref:Uncharacterized protein (DUF58 family) n=1 Tax=Brevibacillus fulvus TaxID=1125967 RepID=A0A939BRI9_9BACL|nr:DUF58 domain-containing protein [Brevibacillus fulvus]MBM7589503.1 uncharacterized protein (DUF58 family) [Brevibacillus fulvus]
MRQFKYGKTKIILLLAVTYVFAKFQGGFASWFLFYSSLSLFCYESLAYVLAFRTLEVTRTIERNRLRDGDDLTVTIRLKRKIWFPLGWNVVIDRLPERLAGVYEEHRHLLFPWFRREIEIRYLIPNVPRGYYQLRECTILAGDYFGFFQRRKLVKIDNDFLVYPQFRQIGHWPTEDGKMSGHIHVSHRRSDDVASVRGIREYQRGDRLSQIHWRATARGLGLKTKEFEQQVMNQLVFFLDVEKRTFPAATDPNRLFEVAVKLTAGLVDFASRQNYHYGLICQQQEKTIIPPANTQTHYFRIFDQLARVMPTGEASFARLISSQSLELAHGVSLVVVTASLQKPLISALLGLAASGRKIQLFLLHEQPTLGQGEKKMLQLLEASRISCKSLYYRDYEQLRNVGGAQFGATVS